MREKVDFFIYFSSPKGVEGREGASELGDMFPKKSGLFIDALPKLQVLIMQKEVQYQCSHSKLFPDSGHVF